MKCLGLHNKPTAEVPPGYKLTGPKEEEEEKQEELDQCWSLCPFLLGRSAYLLPIGICTYTDLGMCVFLYLLIYHI
jgi:hypothetical protein